MQRKPLSLFTLANYSALSVLLVCAFSYSLAKGQSGQSPSPETLPASQLVQPADFARELTSTSAAERPTIVYVGFRTLFAGGHIPGATFPGSGSTTQGLADLKKWAAPLPRTTNLVVYCGCCPFERCPNVRPAFAQLRAMGFTHLRVLELRTSFAADWVNHGFPIEKGAN